MIINHKVFSGDAAHAATTLLFGCRYILTDDHHFAKVVEDFQSKYGIQVVLIRTGTLP